VDCGNHSILILTSLGNGADGIKLSVSSSVEEALVEYDPAAGNIFYRSNGPMTALLRRNEQQFRKVLHSRPSGAFGPGETLTFVIVNDKNPGDFRDRTRLVAIDRRDGAYRVDVVDGDERPIQRLYADGSYLPHGDTAAVAALLENPDGSTLLHTEAVEERNSNLIELLSVIRGLERLPAGRELRIVSDSMYVRKGLGEWIINWKLNDWRTASGRKARHIDYWRRLDNLTADRYIELQWVKGNSGNARHDLCDRTARQTAMGGPGPAPTPYPE